MVTVAKSIDAPIKLVFPRPDSSISSKSQYAMLGLGDVVLPGIMIGLALRFDLWLFYLRLQKRVPATKTSPEVVEKPKYASLAGRWTDHFWTHSFLGRPLWTPRADNPEAPFTFPKTYFRASLAGYIIGMLATLGVMHVWGHAQPALLYLVPGVLGSLWLTALIRGELKLMWNFSEESEEEETENEKAGENKTSERESMFSLSDKKAQAREERMLKAVGKHLVVDGEEDRAEKKGTRSRREVFSFSIEAPRDLKPSKKDKTDEHGTKETTSVRDEAKTT